MLVSDAGFHDNQRRRVATSHGELRPFGCRRSRPLPFRDSGQLLSCIDLGLQSLIPFGLQSLEIAWASLCNRQLAAAPLCPCVILEALVDLLISSFETDVCEAPATCRLSVANELDSAHLAKRRKQLSHVCL